MLIIAQKEKERIRQQKLREKIEEQKEKERVAAQLRLAESIRKDREEKRIQE